VVKAAAWWANSGRNSACPGFVTDHPFFEKLPGQMEQISPACYSCNRNGFHLLAALVKYGSTL
jgi:hypothetical protein